MFLTARHAYSGPTASSEETRRAEEALRNMDRMHGWRVRQFDHAMKELVQAMVDGAEKAFEMWERDAVATFLNGVGRLVR